MKAAHYWGIWPPSAFYQASKEDQAIAVEVYLSEQGIAAYQSHIDSIENQRKSRASNPQQNDVFDD